MEKVSLCIPTYNHPMLRISLTRLQWVDFEYQLIIYNDNPKYKLTITDLIQLGWNGANNSLDAPIIINGDQNLGTYCSSIVLMDLATKLPFRKVLFLDEDDIMLNPDLSKDNLMTYNEYVVLRNFKDVFYLLTPDIKIDKLIHYERYITRLPLWAKTFDVVVFKDLVTCFNKFNPIVFEYFGTQNIHYYNDSILSGIIDAFLEKFYKINYDNVYKSNNLAIGHTYINRDEDHMIKPAIEIYYHFINRFMEFLNQGK